MDSNEVLYDDGKIKVAYFQGSREDLSLTIGGHATILERCTLENLARTNVRNLKGELVKFGFELDPVLKSELISYSTLGLVLAKARICELERELGVYSPER